MAPVPGSPWKCVSRMTSLPPSPHTQYICSLVQSPSSPSSPMLYVGGPVCDFMLPKTLER